MLVKGRQVWSEVKGLYLFLVLRFFEWACLFKMMRKALLKNNQASSTDGMRSISIQDTRARSIRKACLQKWFSLIVMRCGRLTEVYLEGNLVRMISMRVHVLTDLELYLVGSLIICVKLRASS